ncbi:MAG: hypothetical protein WC273_10365, partial [Dehalococcoidia bacterium]
VDHPAGDPESGITERDIAAKFCTLAGSLVANADAFADRLLHHDPFPGARGIVDAVARPARGGPTSI